VAVQLNQVNFLTALIFKAGIFLIFFFQSSDKEDMKSPLLKMDPLSLFSHEIKTPLSSFKLGLSLLEKDFEKNKDILPLLRAELEFVNQLIHNMLDLRRIENKKSVLSLKWTSFNSILEKASSGLKITAGQRGISIKIKKDLKIEVFADPLWLGCILKNLLSNAVRFSVNDKNILVESQYDSRTSQCSCSIKNFSSVKMEKETVFDLFYTKGGSSKGTGLGVNLVQAIIKADKGSMEVKNQGEEVIFSFFLPKARLNSRSIQKASEVALDKA